MDVLSNLEVEGRKEGMRGTSSVVTAEIQIDSAMSTTRLPHGRHTVVNTLATSLDLSASAMN
jgi:hypothetical protein